MGRRKQGHRPTRLSEDLYDLHEDHHKTVIGLMFLEALLDWNVLCMPFLYLTAMHHTL